MFRNRGRSPGRNSPCGITTNSDGTGSGESETEGATSEGECAATQIRQKPSAERTELPALASWEGGAAPNSQQWSAWADVAMSRMATHTQASHVRICICCGNCVFERHTPWFPGVVPSFSSLVARMRSRGV